MVEFELRSQKGAPGALGSKSDFSILGECTFFFLFKVFIIYLKGRQTAREVTQVGGMGEGRSRLPAQQGV